MELNALTDYEFKDYMHDMELLPETHSLRIRRESEHTHIDKFANAKLINTHPEMHRQFIQGWSRSYYSLPEHMRAIFNYATPDISHSRINLTTYQTCVDRIRMELHGLQPVRAFNVETELDLVNYKSSTAAGYDYIGAKGPLHGTNHMRAISRARATIGHVFDNGPEGMEHAIKTMVPDVGYTRTQLADLTDKMKVRNVWGRCFHYILLEGTSADPLIKAFSRTDTFYHIGRDPLDSVPQAISKAAEHGKWLYAIDWKQFDATVSRFEIDMAFDLIGELIEFPNPITHAAFELSRQLFIHKKLAAPDGKTYWVHKGIPSGSYFTSIIGSIVNRMRIEYLWRTIKGRGPNICYTQGDDSLSSDDDLIPPETLAQVANQIGWTFNPSKTEYSTVPNEVTFLGRTLLGGLNTREIKRCLRLLIFPEYPVVSGRISAYRAKSIAQDAGGLSAILNGIADELQAEYGMASEHEVPSWFKRYIA